jgi:hypothetical protein
MRHPARDPLAGSTASRMTPVADAMTVAIARRFGGDAT